MAAQDLMLPDDAFRAQLRRVRARLGAWAESVRGVARVEASEAGAYWRLSAEPAAERACPFELIVHEDQRFDISVGPETYEGQPIGDVQLVAQLVESIGAGRVITRSHVSRNTGAVRSVETIVKLDDGKEWRAGRLNPALAAAVRAQDCEAQDRHYVPYRRP